MTHPFYGKHVLGEFYGIDHQKLDDSTFLENLMREAIAQSGATLCNMQVKKFEPYGVTIVALLSESHASIHTYPNSSHTPNSDSLEPTSSAIGAGALFFDVFTCGTTCEPERAAAYLVKKLKPRFHQLKTVERGIHPITKKTLKSDHNSSLELNREPTL